MFHVVLRHKNGRFWSWQSKGFVTLAQLLQLSKTENLLVIDNVSKRDVTTEVLSKHETSEAQYDTH